MITMRDLRSVPGWFHEADVLLFRWFLEEQRRRPVLGDLAELGAYQGKSAIVIGEYVRDDETFTVVDLFEDPGSSVENRSENRAHYPGLTQRSFEGHYRRFHTRMPVVVKGLTSEVLEHATSGSHRFVHVDASYLYDHVRTDIASARQLLADGGIAVFDDYRATHTAAAVWEAVATDGLQPIVVSANKLYGTWGDAESWIDRARRVGVDDCIGARRPTGQRAAPGARGRRTDDGRRGEELAGVRPAAAPPAPGAAAGPAAGAHTARLTDA